MKRIILFLLFSFSIIYAQDVNFAWISDIHIGAGKASGGLSAIVNNINSRNEAKFVIISGDIAEKGYTKDLDEARTILGELKVPYYIVPGNHDTKWSESGTLHFNELWKSDKFSFEYEGMHFVGISSAIIWNSHSGHYAPEDLKWLDEQLKKIPESSELYFVCHHPLDSETDNWFEITNRLAKHNIKAVLVGHGHSNLLYGFQGIPAAMGRSALEDKNGKWGYTSVRSTKDSLFFYETNIDNIENWGALAKGNNIKYNTVDSSSFLNYNAKISGQYDLAQSAVASLITYKDMIYSVTKNGILSCLDTTAKLIWKYDLHATVLSRPVIADDIIAIGTIEGDLVTLDAINGTMLQTIGLGSPVTSQLAIIDYSGDKAAILGRRSLTAVIAGTASGKLYCYELQSLADLWVSSYSAGMIQALPLCRENKIIYGAWDGYLYCIDSRSGALNWKWSANKNFYYSPAACTPVTDGKYIFVATPDKYVSKIDMLLGKTVWRKNDFDAWESLGLTENKKDLIVKSPKNKIHIVSAKDGKKIKDIDVPFDDDYSPYPPLAANGKILIGLKNGIVYSLDKSYNSKKLFFAGTSRLLEPVAVNDTTTAISNMDGRIFIFNND